MAEPPKTEKIPAIIFASKEAGLKVAALTVLDRLIVVIHRAGAGLITVVTEEPLPELKRTRALGIAVEVVKEAPPVGGKVLVAQGNVLVQTGDVRRCLEAGGSLDGNDGKRVGVGVVNGPELDLGVRDPLDSKRSGTRGDFPYGVDGALDSGERVKGNGVVRVVGNIEQAKGAERALWATMTSSADGFVDRVFNRPVGRFLSKVLIHTAVSPNMVSITSIIIGVIAAVFLAEGSYQSALIGAILFQISAIVDCVDGDIARIVFKESPLGKWIDLAGDQIVHVSVFAGIAFGVLRNGGGKETVWLGISAVLGALISFAVVLRGMRQAGSGNGALQKLIDAATNRDFSVIVLALACVQKLHWFLWMAGIGSHLFWITALGLQLTHKPRAADKRTR